MYGAVYARIAVKPGRKKMNYFRKVRDRLGLRHNFNRRRSFYCTSKFQQMNTNDNEQNAFPTSIAAWLSVRNGPEAVEFYKRSFGAAETYRLETPDGGLVVKLSVDGAAFWVSSDPGYNTDSHPEAPGGGSVRMILTVTDPDAFFENALKAGASQIFAVGEGHGWRIGRLVDPFGLHWEIGRPLKTES
jgi:PhnB protein